MERRVISDWKRKYKGTTRMRQVVYISKGRNGNNVSQTRHEAITKTE